MDDDMAKRVSARYTAKGDKSDPDVELPPADPDTHEVDRDTGKLIGHPVPDPSRGEKRPNRR